MRMHKGLRIASICVVFAGALLAICLMALTPIEPQKAALTTIETTAEQCSAQLADHSLLQLNHRTILTAEMLSNERRIVLSRGEARFRVAKDPNKRPFVVSTPHGEIQALGTIFNVRVRDDGTAVTVLEGQVKAQGRTRDASVNPQSFADAGVVLEEGQYALIADEGSIALFTGTSPDQAMSWPRQDIDFTNQHLSAVLAEFSKYHPHPVKVLDPTLALHEISGTFNVYDVSSFLAYLEKYEHVRIEYQHDGSKVLRNREGPARGS